MYANFFSFTVQNLYITLKYTSLHGWSFLIASSQGMSLLWLINHCQGLVGLPGKI